MHDFPEEDWRRLRPLRERAVERFYERTLAETAAVAADASVTASDRYHRLYKLVKERDQDLAAAFDNPRRSTAWTQLCCGCAGSNYSARRNSRASRPRRNNACLCYGNFSAATGSLPPYTV